MKSAPLLRFCGLRKTLGGNRLLLDVDDFAIAPGSCTLLTGPNGVGKTTLLKILAGLEPPDAARVEYDGTSLRWPTARRRFRRDVIYLHQQAYLFDRSVADNVAYGLRGLRRARDDTDRRVTQVLDWAGLTHLADRNARELSGGEKQRVAFARAIVLAPRVLLLDEPFAGLDEEARNRTAFLIQRMKSDAIAVVLTSHDPLPSFGIAELHLELRAGRLVEPTLNASVSPGAHAPADGNSRPHVVYLGGGVRDESN
jgi:tungstate transport system ATP-binding protein